MLYFTVYSCFVISNMYFQHQNEITSCNTDLQAMQLLEPVIHNSLSRVESFTFIGRLFVWVLFHLADWLLVEPQSTSPVSLNEHPESWMYLWSTASHYSTSWQPGTESCLPHLSRSWHPVCHSLNPSAHPVDLSSHQDAIYLSTFLCLNASPDSFLSPLHFKTSNHVTAEPMLG